MDESPRREREHFRIPYPPGDQPVIRLGTDEYFVTELSEGGLKLCPSDKWEFGVGQIIIGTMTFSDRQAVDISGTVSRCESDEVAIAGLQGVDFSRMMQEQRRLVSKYPSVRIYPND